MKCEEIIYQKVYVSPRPPPTISYKDNWMNELDSEVAGSSKDTQRIQPKPKTHLSSTVRPVAKWSEETLERTKFDRDTLNQEKHDNVTDPTSTGRPVGGQESTKEIEKGILFDHEDIKHSTRTERYEGGLESTQSCVSMPIKIEEEDQTGTGRPAKVEELDIDFRVPGTSHAVVKEAEHLRVQELVKKTESNPHREALQADLQQNNVEFV